MNGLTRMMPWILRGLGYGLSVPACIETGRACVRAYKVIEDKEMEDAPFKEKAKETYKFFIKPAVIFAASIGCHIGGDVLLLRRIAYTQALLASAVAAHEISTDRLHKAIKDVVGEKKHKAIEERAQQNMAKDHLPKSSRVIQETGYGNTLFFEPLSGQWFYSSHERILTAKLNINNLMDVNDTADVDDLLTEYGIKPGSLSRYWGWELSKMGEHLDIGWLGSGSDDEKYGDPVTGEYIPYNILTYSRDPWVLY